MKKLVLIFFCCGVSYFINAQNKNLPLFSLMDAKQTGVDFTNVLTDARAAENQIRLKIEWCLRSDAALHNLYHLL